jgi:hypothetical protein
LISIGFLILSLPYTAECQISIEEVKRSVVKFESKEGRGAGVIVNLDKERRTVEILTCCHILPLDYIGSSTIEFYRESTFPLSYTGKSNIELGKEPLPVEIRYLEDDHDLMAIRISNLPEYLYDNISFLFLADSIIERRSIGEEIITIGHPASEDSWSVAYGKATELKGAVKIQFSGISKGYSGGPLVNNKGIMIGMNKELNPQKEGVALRSSFIREELKDEIPFPSYYFLKIFSQPPEVEVRIDGRLKGTTDEDGIIEIPLSEGLYSLSLSKQGHSSVEREIKIPDKKELRIRLDRPSKESGMWSLVFPGSGQFRNGHPLWGAFYMLIEAAAIVSLYSEDRWIEGTAVLSMNHIISSIQAAKGR